MRGEGTWDIFIGRRRFKNPQNGYVEEVTDWAMLWCLLFGSLYFLVKGVWVHAIASFILVFLTFGLSWLLYPVYAPILVVRSYQRKGWVELDDNGEPLSDASKDKTADTDSRPTPIPPTQAQVNKVQNTWDGERDLNSMPYKLYLSKKYEINKNDLFDKYIVGDTAHDTLDEALKYADGLETER